MKTIQKTSILMLLTGFFMFSFAQENPTKQMPEKTKKEKKMKKMKKHECTEACHASGHHVYLHGEKGHVCDENCKMK